MTRSNNNVWLHRFACALALATLGLVALGGVVTTKGVGMAVPDWPTTYGDHMFLFPPSKWMGGIFYEHSHRLWASLVGLLAAVFALWVWWRDARGWERGIGIAGMLAALGLMGVRTPGMFVAMGIVSLVVMVYAIWRAARESDRLRWLGLIAFAAVIVQGVLGGLRVTLDEHGWGTEFGIFHATLAQLFFLFVCSLALLTSKWWSNAGTREVSAPANAALRKWYIAATVLILLQLIFGATMRHQHAGLAVPDFPLAYGKLWPATDPASVASYNQHRLEAAGEAPITAQHIVVHMLHRFTGILVLLTIVAAAAATWRCAKGIPTLRGLAGAWVALAIIQVILGILTIWSQRKVDVTTAHVALGALTFMVGWTLVLVSTRRGVAVAIQEEGRAVISNGVPNLKHA